MDGGLEARPLTGNLFAANSEAANVDIIWQELAALQG